MNNRNINRLALTALAMALSGAASAQFVVHDPVNAVAIAVTSVQTTVNVEESIASKIISGANAATNAANLVTANANALTNTITTGATLAGVIHQAEIEDAIRNLELDSGNHFEYIVNNNNEVNKHWQHLETNNTTNNYYDGGITLPPVDPTPIPFAMPIADLAAHQDQFKSMTEYAESGELVAGTNHSDASAAVRDTNAAHLSYMSQQGEELAETAGRLEELGKGMTQTAVLQSRNAQLQYANLIGLENTAQLVRMRQAMLVSENANNARAQLEADMQARQFANGARISEAADLSSANTSW